MTHAGASVGRSARSRGRCARRPRRRRLCAQRHTRPPSVWR